MFVSLLVLNCDPLARRRARHPKPVQSEEPKVEEAPKPKPKPKAKPKCESLEEKCVAAAETRLIIGSSKVTVQVPEGWTYAKQETLSVAVPPEEDVALAFVESESDQPDKLLEAITPLLDELKITGVKLQALKPRLKKAQATMEAGSAPVSIWEVDKASNGGADPKMQDEPGKLGVFVTTIDGTVVVGAAFMQKKADAARGAATGQAVQTLRSGT
jgi:hypothetical protein